jgi:hypothetical protein
MEVNGPIWEAMRGARSWRRARGAERMREAIMVMFCCCCEWSSLFAWVMILEMGFLLRYWKVGRRKQMSTTRMSERWKANLPDRRDTLYSYQVPRETTQLQALPLAVARVPKPASYPSRPRQAQAPDRRRTEMLKESIRRYDPGSLTFYGLEKSKRPEMEGSQRHTAATARPESMGGERGRWPELDRKSHGSQSGNP